jgi:hypothetical protein
MDHVQCSDQTDNDADGGGPAGDEEGEDTLAITVCSMGADGTFEVTVKRDALVDGLVDAIAESRGIANARRLVAVHVAGEAEPLAGTQSVVGRMAEAGASELFMLLRACDDRRVLEEIYNRGGGENWNRYSCSSATRAQAMAGWMTDAPLSVWKGVTADADGNVTALELDQIAIDQAGVVALAEALPGLRITRLYLEGCEVTDAGVVALAEALPGSQVTALDLRNNQITDAGTTALAEGLPGSQVTALDLRNNQITDAGTTALADGLPGSQITTLQLSNNQTTDAGAVALAEALPGSHITTLELGVNQITDAGAVALAESLPGSQVTALDLIHNQITDAGAVALAQALPGSQVTALGLDNNHITDAGAVAFAEVVSCNKPGQAKGHRVIT